MNVLEVFHEAEVVKVLNEVLFKANDIALFLGYCDPKKAIARHVDEEDVFRWGTIKHHSKKNIRLLDQTKFINESGIYSLIIGSKLPSAKKWKRWITSEVLPSLRKTGTYSIPDEDKGRILKLTLELIERIDENRIS